MIKFQYFPKSKVIPEHLNNIVGVFSENSAKISSDKFLHPSNNILREVSSGLETLGFVIEKSKKSNDKIKIPVLFGINGKLEKYFDADGFNSITKTVIEIEAGRAVANYQFLKDLFQACMMTDVDYLVIAVRKIYRKNPDFQNVVTFFDTLFTSGRLKLPLKRNINNWILMKAIDYSLLETVSAIPEASSMIETFRAIGYNIETAVADIIDNSISAKAKSIWVNFEWLGSKTWLSIKDDGDGMDDPELIQAMRPGSKNPLQDRGSKDLGRFGLGLKTASFSQARKLSVISKKADYNSVYWTWDLDFVNQTGKWELIKYLPDEKFENDLLDFLSGTIVIWNDIDRVVKNFKQDDNKALDKFLLIMEQVKKHLSMVFHKLIESGKINVYFQDHKIEPWNPFLLDESSTQIFPEERIQNGVVKIEGYVLPHKSKISEEKYKQAEGTKGWNEQQGFYIYRNERLLLAGDWLGLFRKEEHYKLTRIQIELPNTLDAEWQIDIKKSVARPPLIFREQIKAYAMKVRAQAVEVYRHKGKNVKPVAGQKFIPLWVDHKRGDKWFYKINREHPVIERVKEQAKNEPEKAIEMLVRFIEETIPTKSIFIKESEIPELQGKPFEGIDHEIIRNTMQAMYSNLTGQGKTDEQAKAIITNIEPFNSFVHFLEFLN